MFRYRLHTPDGDDLGEATYTVMIKPGGGDPRDAVLPTANPIPI